MVKCDGFEARPEIQSQIFIWPTKSVPYFPHLLQRLIRIKHVKHCKIQMLAFVVIAFKKP